MTDKFDNMLPAAQQQQSQSSNLLELDDLIKLVIVYHPVSIHSFGIGEEGQFGG